MSGIFFVVIRLCAIPSVRATAAISRADSVPKELAAPTGDTAVLHVLLVEIDAVAIEVVRPVIFTALVEAIK
jgi:hypothetical protein